MKHKYLFLIIGFILLITVGSLTLFIVNYNRIHYVRDIAADVQETDITKDRSIRIGTYNVKSLDMGNALQEFTDEIDVLDLDILGLQEVDKDAYRSGNLDMVKEMAKQTGYPYSYFFPSMWIIDGYYGLGILSRFPILQVSSLQLPGEVWQEPRILAHAKIDLSGTVLDVFITHLSYEDTKSREKQVRFLEKQLANRTNTLLLGDFNTFGSRRDFVIDGMNKVNDERTPFLTFRDFGRPDNIYYSNDMNMQNVQVHASSFSDHNLLFGELEIQKP